MRILLVGAGGVGSAIAAIAARRTFVEQLVVADYDLARAEKAVAAVGRPAVRRGPGRRDRRGRRRGPAGRAPLRRAAQRHRPALRHAAVPGGAGRRRALPGHGDVPVPAAPGAARTRRPGVKLGDEQFALAGEWEAAGPARAGRHRRRARAVRRLRPLRRRPPVRRDRRARRPRRLEPDRARATTFAPSFNIWTTIEECLNPPVIWERDRGWFTTEPFSEPEVFDFPEGIGPVECVNVEHEEVLLMPRWVDARRVTFKYGLGDRVHRRPEGAAQGWAWTRTTPVRGRGVEVSPARRRRRGAARPGRAGRADERQDLRRAVGQRHRHGRAAPRRSTCTTWSTTPGR